MLSRNLGKISNEGGYTLNNRFSLETKQQLLLEEDTIQDFHSYRGEVNVWLQSSEDQLTLLLEADATGHLKSKPMFIYHSEMLEPLNYVISTLSVLYKWANKA